jgi:hypothetical protein
MTFNKEMDQDALLSEEAERSSFSDPNAESQTESFSFQQASRGAPRLTLFPWKAILIHTFIFIVYTVLLLFVVVPILTSHETGS